MTARGLGQSITSASVTEDSANVFQVMAGEDVISALQAFGWELMGHASVSYLVEAFADSRYVRNTPVQTDAKNNVIEFINL